MRPTHLPAALMTAALALSPGPGAGCESANPVYCDSATPCAAGQACDLEASTCVDASLALDPTGWFIDDADRWWTTLAAPVLRGSLDDPNGPTIQAYVDGTPIGPPAAVNGSTWELTLPEGTLSTTAANPLEIRLVADGRSTAVGVTVVVDPTPAALALASSTVLDERDDAVTFDASGPLHEHLGAPVELTATGCPDVYKYGYLTTATPPEFGREVGPNPLRFNLGLTRHPLSAPTLSYDVQPQGGVPLVAAVAMPAPTNVGPGQDTVAVDVVRDVVPGLSTTEGPMELVARVTDWAGRVTLTTTCWTHHPLAAPLEGAPLAMGEFSLASVVSVGAPDAAVVERALTQHTSDAVSIELTLDPTGFGMGSQVRNEVAPEPRAGLQACGTCTGPAEPACVPTTTCTTGVPANPADPASVAATNTPTWAVDVVELTPAPVPVVCTSASATTVRCVLPGRAAGGPPRSFLARGLIDRLPSLAPAGFQPISVAGVSLIGVTTGSERRVFGACEDVEEAAGGSVRVTRMCPMADFVSYSAIDTATITVSKLDLIHYDSVGLKLTSAASSSLAPTPPYHGVFDDRLSFSDRFGGLGQSWDYDLPGSSF